MGKGSATTTSQSSTAPNPQAMALYQQILQGAQGVAQTPYQAYTGQLTAPVNSQQTAGINNINANANSAAPAIGQATSLAQGAANPLTASQIQNYQNPYTQNVVDATQAQFNDQNAQGQAALKGNTIAQGALGGNRAGVASGVLAGQQQLAQAPTIANLYANSYNSGLGTAAQQYQQNPLAAAGSLANFGISGQNAALQGAGQQINAGTLQQQTQQAQDTANYGQFQNQQAYPFQVQQWLANIGTGVGQQLGTTTSGTTTGPAPNPWGQILGLGVTAAAAAANRGGRIIHKDGGGGIGGMPYGVGAMPYGDAHGYVPTANLQTHALQAVPFVKPASQATSGNASLQTAAKAAGKWWGTDDAPATMGSPGVSSPLMTYGAAGDYAVPTFVANGGAVHGYADGGMPTMDERFAPIVDAIHSGQLDPQGANSTDFSAPSPIVASDAPKYVERPPVLPPESAKTPTRSTKAAPIVRDDDDELPPASTPTAGVGAPATPYARDDAKAGFATPAPTADATPEKHFGLGLLSPNAKTALLTAGLGMLSSRSPFLGNAIGEGGMAGLNAYGAAHAADTKAKQDALKQRMDEQRVQREADSLAETIRHNKASEANASDKAPPGYQRQKDGTLQFIAGGPHDPERIAAETQARTKKGTELDDDTVDAVAQRVAQGDTKAVIGLGRNPTAIAQIQKRTAEIFKEQGLDHEAGAKAILGNIADQAGRTTAERTQAGIAAKLAVYGRNVDNAIGVASKASEDVNRTNFTPVNRALNAYRENTGDPKVVALGQALNTLTNEYARAIGSGHGTVHDKEQAEHKLNQAQSHEQLLAIMDVMHKEIQMTKKSMPEAREEMRELYSRPSSEKMRAPGATSAAPSAGAAPPFTPPAGAVPRAFNGKTYWYDPNTKQPIPGQ